MKSWIKENRDEMIYNTFILLFIPIFGFLYLIILWILKRVSYSSVEGLESYEAYVRHKQEHKAVIQMDFEKEVNIVPIEEALVLNESKIKRKLIIDVLKEDPSAYIKILKRALEDKDTETTHYAATALTTLKSQFAINLQALSVKYEQNKNQQEVLVSYIELLEKYLESGLLDAGDYNKYLLLYSQILEEVLDAYTQDEKFFISKIHCDIKRQDFRKARQYCDIFFQIHPQSEEAYMTYMKLFYILGDYKSFNSILEELKTSPLKLSSKALNSIRFWAGGENDFKKNDRHHT